MLSSGKLRDQMNNSEQLRSLVAQAFGELRRYENAVIQSDKDAAAIAALVPATERWHRVLNQFYEIRLRTPILPPELKTEVKKLDDAIESSNARTRLVPQGQLREIVALRKTTEEMHARTNQALAKILQVKEDVVQHEKEFREKWLREHNLTEASMDEAQTTQYIAAVQEETDRWITNKLGPISDAPK
jgi:hypothetical protein